MNRKSSGRGWRVARRLSQVSALAAFLIMLFHPSVGSGLSRLFLSFDPLAVLTGLRGGSPGLLPVMGFLAVGLAIAVGRAFCGWICPLGTVIDAWDVVALAKTGPGILGEGRTWLWPVKFLVLTVAAVCCLLGVSVLLALDPISMMTRTSTAVVRMSMSFFENGLAVVLVFVLVPALSLLQKRFWCRNLCPLGALLGLIGRWSMLRYVIGRECTSCDACSRVCPTGAVEQEPRNISMTECILCSKCVRVCPVDCISFGGSRTMVRSAVNVSRRHLLGAAGAGVALSFVGKISSREISSVIRPPGSIEEKTFIQKCIRCGRCIQSCPTEGLQVCLFDVGFDGIFTPRMVNRLPHERGGCIETCNSCGEVCPTGAVRSLPLDEKNYARMGTARVKRESCLPWFRKKECVACQEVCPFSAIDAVKRSEMKGAFDVPYGFDLGRALADEEEGASVDRAIKDYLEAARKSDILVPIVNRDACMGCGLCERACPVEGRGAIVVSPAEADRRSSGSYATPDRVGLRDRRQAETRSAEDW